MLRVELASPLQSSFVSNKLQTVCHLTINEAETMEKRKQMTPWLMLGGIITMLIVIAQTEIMSPVIQFVHNDQGNNWQLVAFAMLGVFGFRIAFVLLNAICHHYSTLFDERLNRDQGKSKQKEVHRTNQ